MAQNHLVERPSGFETIIRELQNPDVIEVNGEKFQVIDNISLWYHPDKKELEMAIELAKVGDRQLSPKYRLAYVYERPEKMRFFVLDTASKVFREQELQ
ncbi:hypothetical protein HY640_01455 [Candidatus Woesearchaeota archaeon]|nr:hypothetical protein [Candidatus Woesearchaeota archaeon]